MSIFGKREKELEVGKFFTFRYNKENNSNYTIEICKEDQDIDCFMLSSNMKTINLQMRTYDNSVIDAFIESRKEKWKWIDICSWPDECIIDGIVEKSKKYSLEEKQDIVLILWSYYSTYDINSGYLQLLTKNVCDSSNFKNIYVVRLPDNDSGDIIKLR